MHSSPSNIAPVVTRFAPSPTGYLHVGGARTALFNWLLAKNTGGQYLLRIEDTDLARSTEDAVRQLVEDLNWLGLKHDNAELVYQSKRLHIYNELIDSLVAKGHAYEAWETIEELDAMRKQAERSKRAFIYRKRAYSADELKRFADEGRKPIIRFVMPVKEYRFHDVVLGKDVVQPPQESQDFVIRKTDGMPTYHFGVVVDDAQMGITHVLRGLEHLKNTFNHIALQEALGYARPVYAHLSVMLNPETGEKLSKRDRDRRIRKRVQELMRSTKRPAEELAKLASIDLARFSDWLATDTQQLDLSEQPRVMKVIGLKESDLPEIMVHDFRKNGFAPEVLLNFLAMQGWSTGDNTEQMSVDEMVQRFSLDRLNSANPKFNRDKLKSFSTTFFGQCGPERQLAVFKDYLSVNPQSPLGKAADAQLATVLLMNKGFHTLAEVDEKSRFMFIADEALEYDAAAIDKILIKNDKQGLIALKAVTELIAAIDDFKAPAIEAAVKSYAQTSGLGLGKVAQPIRVAVCGSAISPPIFECLEFIGKASSLARLRTCAAINE